MADEVPICDVLCEAMEYLVKLGSNLRSRSASLKEKRIRKDKLKNSHAVQKAADKVLLICELSKKSLENVECGVRKVISLVNQSQDSSSCNATSSTSTKRPSRMDNYKYFTYESRKLRVSKNVPVKHFMSVKVLAPTLPVAQQDKYPVYYDCKLYRHRKRETKRDSSIDKKSCTEVASPEAGDDIKNSIIPKNNDSSAKPIGEECSELQVSYGTEIADIIPTSGSTTFPKRLSEDSDETAVHSKSKIKSNDNHTNKSSEIAAKKRFKHIKVIDDDSSSSNNETVMQFTESTDTTKASTENTSPLPETIELKADEETNKIVEQKSSDENTAESLASVSSKPLIKCVSLNKLLKADVLQKTGVQDKNIKQKNKGAKKYDLKESRSKHNNKIEEKNKDMLKCMDEEYWSEKRKEVKAFKPKSFTVNVNRLPKLNKQFLDTYNLKRITQNTNIICEVGLSNIESTSLDVEKELPLMVESMAEKIKNCLNNVGDKNNEKKVQQNDSKNNNIVQNKEIDEFKNALLYESDSDEIPMENGSKDTLDVNEKQKKLVDEDAGNVETLNIGFQENENLGATTEADKDLDKTKTTDNEISPLRGFSPIKETNLDNKNENTHSKTPPKGEKTPKDKTPKSRKKRMMESMQAKKMLLTYSSSSDSEDEKIRNALNAIKKSLLKVVSSEDENTPKKNSEKPSHSESDEGTFKKSRRKRKLSKSSDKDKTVSNEDNPEKRSKCDESTEDQKSNSSRKKMGRSRARHGGSGQNSDSQEAKAIDGLTNLNSLMKKRRRRISKTSETTDSSSAKQTSRTMAKAPLISEENMLKSDSSSEAASGAESDVVEEDLPQVSISGLNGSGIDHLAKDDLLDESDSSSTHNEKDEGSKNDSEEDQNPKSKRRKAHAISSDSEVGSSRKKDRDVKLSDFEDSDDETSESRKKGKRKKDIDSDASAGSSSSGSKKKRRRIKQLNDSDGSGSDTENEGRNKHGRKNIRKVMGKNQLEEATKKAAREEKERIARISERQKLYNNLEFDESGKPDEVVLDKVILDFDPETKEPLIEVDRGLVRKLKPHQANGIKFMWNACFESVKRIKKDKGSGCILAHCMGLGKTLQVVSLTHTLLIHGDLTSVNRVLVVCPLSTVLNWVNEFKMWLKHSETEYDVDVYELSRYKQNSERAYQLQQWFENGGVCVLGYEMFRNLSADNNKKFKKKMLKNFQEALVEPGPDLVVCDEGHLLKNEKTSLSQSMNRVRTRRRIVLTGTPLQNNLKEYYCMVQFVKPNLLGKYNEYLNRFVNPITNGQYTDSTEHDIRIMKRRSHVLHKMLDGAVQRRDYGVLAPFLPPKHEYVIFITLTEVQIKLYQFYLDNYSRRPLAGKSSGFLFPDFQSLQRIWTHPLVLKYNSERYEIMQQKKREREEEEDSEGSLVDFIDDESTPNESTSEESSDDMSDVSDDSRKKSKKKKSPKKGKAKDSKGSTRRGTRANPVELLDDDAVAEVVEIKTENPTEWWIKLVTDDELDDLKHSHKLVLLFDILRQCEAIGDKLLVFSQSLYSLDLIEHFLGKVDEATQEGRIDEKLGGHVGSWSPGVDYFRLDGSTSCENRSIWCKNFNREDNPRARLFLISTRAGGLGINLVAANRVVIFDVSWNPSHDVQSIFRVYRFGQKKPCYVYRFLAMGTMEEKIYERQVTKQAISKRVIDEQQIDRHYAENDLAELYKFEAEPPTPRPIPPLPKDRLFAEMLREHEAQIYKYHEHDSLLENKEEETLSEEERKAAWDDFENEKNRPPPAPFPTAWPMHNGMMPGLLAQQQQQLAYAALAAMLRKDMPSINDNQIRDMLPLIYNANPALMQKMSDIYKYAPPGGAMMNPGMMNPVMNPGSGGSSGLQYEPPWQRQQQQQQQMRLQQLMQHQSLGAKYYAGGLGSRDPVAMALQQQRAREIMAERASGGGGAGAGAAPGGQGAGRPRGRPPLQRVSTDVVTVVDSD